MTAKTHEELQAQADRRRARDRERKAAKRAEQAAARETNAPARPGTNRVLAVVGLPGPAEVAQGYTHGAILYSATQGATLPGFPGGERGFLTRNDREKELPPEPAPATVQTYRGNYSFQAGDIQDIARAAALVCDDIEHADENYAREMLSQAKGGQRVVIDYDPREEEP